MCLDNLGPARLLSEQKCFFINSEFYKHIYKKNPSVYLEFRQPIKFITLKGESGKGKISGMITWMVELLFVKFIQAQIFGTLRQYNYPCTCAFSLIRAADRL